jgi:dTDP-4-amino-4,6-dideoxygalactose transaminase
VPGLRTVEDPPWGESNFQSFWVEVGDDYPLSRNELLTALAGEGISARAGIMAAHRQPAYEGRRRDDLPITERLTERTLILPMFHTMTEGELQRVVALIRRSAGLRAA